MMVRGPASGHLSAVDLPVLTASSLYVKGVAVPRFYTAWTLEGGVTAEVSAAPEQERVPYLLTIRTPGRRTKQLAGVLEVSWSRAGHSGRRGWLHCGSRGCRYRTDRLYLLGRRLSCRHCAGVQYASKNRPPHLRARVKADKLRLRLGGEPGPRAPLPLSRPKGMHSSRFERLLRELVETETRYRRLLRPILDREHDCLAARWGTWLTSDRVSTATPALPLLLAHALESKLKGQSTPHART